MSINSRVIVDFLYSVSTLLTPALIADQRWRTKLHVFLWRTVLGDTVAALPRV